MYSVDFSKMTNKQLDAYINDHIDGLLTNIKNEIKSLSVKISQDALNDFESGKISSKQLRDKLKCLKRPH